MSIHGSLAGQSWSHFHGISGTSTPSHSPRPPSPPPLRSYSCSDDVMKLPARDMHIFGICPSQDDFLLVICEICGKRIKLEAFESHNVSRHGSQRQKDARKAMLNDKASALDLIKEDLFNNTPPAPIISASSSSCTSPSLPQRIKTPVKTEEELAPISTSFSTKMEVVEEVEEGDSLSATTNNVISIPDNEPLPAGMSNDLMAMVEESSGSLVLPPPTTVVTATTTVTTASSSNSIILPSKNLLSSESCCKHSPSKKPRSERRQNSRDREYHPDKHCGVWDNDSKKHCTRALTCKSHSVLLKRKIPGRSKSFDELVVEHKAVKEAAALAAKAAASSLVDSPSVVVVQTLAAQPQATPNPPIVHNGVTPRIAPAVSPLPPPPPPPQATSPAEENLFYTTDHPKPLAVCSFGGRRIANTLNTNRGDVFTRKVLRLAYSSQGVNRFNNGDRFRVLKQTHNLRTSPSPQVMMTSYNSDSPTGGAIGNSAAATASAGGGFLVNYNLSNSSLNHSPLVKMSPGTTGNPSATPSRLSTGIKLSSLQQNIILQDGFKNTSTTTTTTSDFSGIQFEFGN